MVTSTPDDLQALSDDEFTALALAVQVESSRRGVLARAALQITTIQQEWAVAAGRADGDPWVQPTGAHDTYALDAIVTHDGKTWQSTTPNNVWTPGVSGWREMIETTNPDTAVTAPAWIQPTGAHDAYALGDRVTYDGKTWQSTVGANVWTPGVYGWGVVA